PGRCDRQVRSGEPECWTENGTDTTKPGWFARLSYCGTGSSVLFRIGKPECRELFCHRVLQLSRLARHGTEFRTKISKLKREKPRATRKSHVFKTLKPETLKLLHHHRQVFQLMLEYWQSATGHLDAPRGVERCRGRNAISAAHQKYSQKFGCLVRVEHPTLEQVIPDRSQLRHRESVFVVVHHLIVRHGRHHLRFRPLPH